jgi:hypothetical protein
MKEFGILIFAFAVVPLLVALWNRRKMKKILAAPFVKTAVAASNPAVADANGTISVEGAIVPTQPFVAPCSGTPCVYFEITVQRQVEKSETTENGTSTSRSWQHVSSVKEGAYFQVNDGSGPVNVDARQKVDADLKQSYEQTQNVSSGDLRFGGFSTNVGWTAERVLGIRCTEKIVPAQGTVFVLGKLVQGAIATSDGMLGKLKLSLLGRDKLVGRTKLWATLAFVWAGSCAVPGLPMAIFADWSPDAPPSADTSCAGLLKTGNEFQDKCTSKVMNNDGETFTWNVTKPAIYAIHAEAPSHIKLKIIAGVTVKRADGTLVEDNNDASSTFESELAAGAYTVTIKDEAGVLKGGQTYDLTVKKIGDVPGSASVTNAVADAGPTVAKPVAKAGGPKLAGPTVAASGSTKPAGSTAAPAGSAKPAPKPADAKSAAKPPPAKPAGSK